MALRCRACLAATRLWILILALQIIGIKTLKLNTRIRAVKVMFMEHSRYQRVSLL